MAKTLVAYFSCGGTTRRVAQAIAQATGGVLFEIEPEMPYTRADLDWNNQQSRSSVEMNDPSSRPAIAHTVEDMDAYDTVFVGFPIWWYREPSIIDTFLEAYDFSNATIVPFCTSGGSGTGKIDERVRTLRPTARAYRPARLLNGASQAEIARWVESL